MRQPCADLQPMPPAVQAGALDSSPFSMPTRDAATASGRRLLMRGHVSTPPADVRQRDPDRHVYATFGFDAAAFIFRPSPRCFHGGLRRAKVAFIKECRRAILLA